MKKRTGIMITGLTILILSCFLGIVTYITRTDKDNPPRYTIVNEMADNRLETSKYQVDILCEGNIDLSFDDIILQNTTVSLKDEQMELAEDIHHFDQVCLTFYREYDDGRSIQPSDSKLLEIVKNTSE